jgi:hypothetical protein
VEVVAFDDLTKAGSLRGGHPAAGREGVRRADGDVINFVSMFMFSVPEDADVS